MQKYPDLRYVLVYRDQDYRELHVNKAITAYRENFALVLFSPLLPSDSLAKRSEGKLKTGLIEL